MKEFTRDDGRTLRVVEGFRKRVVSLFKKGDWTDADYSEEADRRLQDLPSLLYEFSGWGGTLKGAAGLEVGCGVGTDCTLMGLQPLKRAVGIDLQLPSRFEPSENEKRKGLRLTRKVLETLGLGGNIVEVLNRLPVHFAVMDATAMGFPDGGFDFLWSRNAMEHIIPIDKALAEMARVVRPGGLIYHNIDPYFWLDGCHTGGLVDIPWAHARLTLEEFRRFVTEIEGKTKAVKRSRHLLTLNRFTLRRWRQTIEEGPFEILEWEEDCNPIAEKLLDEYPEVEDSLLEGVEHRDLIHAPVKVWLRNKGN